MQAPGSFMLLAMDILPSSGFSPLQNVLGKPIALPADAWFDFNFQPVHSNSPSTLLTFWCGAAKQWILRLF